MLALALALTLRAIMLVLHWLRTCASEAALMPVQVRVRALMRVRVRASMSSAAIPALLMMSSWRSVIAYLGLGLALR